MTINQVSVFMENKAGQLAQVCKLLAENDISLVALSIAETQDFGIARLIVSDHAKAEDVLRKARFLVKTQPVVAVTVPDVPGGMAKVVTVLSEKGCDIEYSYAFSLNNGEKAVLVFRFKDELKVAAVLADAGLSTLTDAALKN